GDLGHAWTRGRAAAPYPDDRPEGPRAGPRRSRGRRPVKAFAELLDRLAYTPSRNDKLRLLSGYFASTPDPERGLALAALTAGWFFRLPLRRILTDLVAARVDPVLFDLSRDYVGDTAETIALIWTGGGKDAKPPRLAGIVEALQSTPPGEIPALLRRWVAMHDAHRPS